MPLMDSIHYHSMPLSTWMPYQNHPWVAMIQYHRQLIKGEVLPIFRTGSATLGKDLGYVLQPRSHTGIRGVYLVRYDQRIVYDESRRVRW